MANGWPWGSRKADHHIRLPEAAKPLNTVSRPSELRISLACRPRRLPTRRRPPSGLHLPFALLSDSDFRLLEALRLPTFEIAGMRLLKRLTMVISEHQIEHVFYPVFPPDRIASDVIDRLNSHR